LLERRPRHHVARDRGLPRPRRHRRPHRARGPARALHHTCSGRTPPEPTTRRAFRMTPRESDTNPFLGGNFAPWRMEGDAGDLEIRGELPRQLNGVFYRNGPNPAYEPLGRYHWFD